MSTRCPDCGCELAVTEANQPARPACPACGSARRAFSVKIVETMRIHEEIAEIVTDKHGSSRSERISRTDGNTSSELAADVNEPVLISAKRLVPIEGVEEEGIVAEKLAKARNAKLGTMYSVRPKAKEDGGYADRVLVSTTDNPKEIEVQVTHFDKRAIAGIKPKEKSGAPGEFKAQREVGELAKAVDNAIMCKAGVDPAAKALAILLLQTPAVLGKMVRQQLQRTSFEMRGFKEVWIAPFREEAFEVFTPLKDENISVAAYYLSEKAGRPPGEEQRFWFAAIDQLRGL